MKRQLKLITPKPALQNEAPALRAQNLGKIFSVGRSFRKALENITFAVAPGELICLIGPSGCGKTTLLKIAAGFMPASSGSLSVYGQPVTRPGPDRCVVFQEDALFPWLTVEENIAFGLKTRRRYSENAKAEVGRFLDLVGLTAFRHYLPREISGGMKQRVALARVLILKPKVLLMDEPFGALDAQTREEMQDLLLGLWESLAHTILFVTHDITEALTLADRILIMDTHPGRIRSELAVGLPRPHKKESASFHNFYGRLRKMLAR